MYINYKKKDGIEYAMIVTSVRNGKKGYYSVMGLRSKKNSKNSQKIQMQVTKIR